MSHPLRVRELKPIATPPVSEIVVAPVTGACIETEIKTLKANGNQVAPFTGA